MACTVNHTNYASQHPDLKFCGHCGDKLESFRVATGPETNYVTVLACINPQRALVAVMHYSKIKDSYEIYRCSEPLTQKSAGQLAESWAAALKLEVR